MLSVVIITSGFPKDENEGNCVPFLQLYINELLKQNVVVNVITEAYPIKDNYSWNGINVYTLKKRKLNIISKILKPFRFKAALKTISSQQKIDVIHNIWFSEIVMQVQKYAISNKIKHITTFAGQDILKSNKALRNLDQYSGELVCVSDFQKREFSKNFKQEPRVIGWGIENIEIESDSERRIDLIFAGWISELKNCDQFIDIVFELNKLNLLNKVVICGDGLKMENIRERIKSLNLQSLIELTGSIDRAEVLSLMKKSKILVHTSSYESFGLVLAEGLACNCHVVSKPVGIAYENKDVFVCKTTIEFVDQIKQLLLSKKIAAHQNIYRISDTVKSYISMYESKNKNE